MLNAAFARRRAYVPYAPAQRQYALPARNTPARILLLLVPLALVAVGLFQSSGLSFSISSADDRNNGASDAASENIVIAQAVQGEDDEVYPLQAAQKRIPKRHGRVEALKRRRKRTANVVPRSDDVSKTTVTAAESAGGDIASHAVLGAAPTQAATNGAPSAAPVVDTPQQYVAPAPPSPQTATIETAVGRAPEPPRALCDREEPAVKHSAVTVSASGWVEPATLGLARTAARITEKDTIGCTMPTGATKPYGLPVQPWAREFDHGRSSGFLLNAGNGHMEDEYLFHSVKLVGKQLFVHNLRYHVEGAEQGDSSAMPLRGGDRNADLHLGLEVVDSPTPLDCPPEAVPDEDWLYMLASSTENTFHQLNDNIFPYWQAAQQLAAGREAALGPPAEGSTRPKLVLYIGKTLVNWNMASGSMWNWAIQTGFDSVVGSTPTTGVCLRNLRVGRPRKLFWASFQSVMQYLSHNVVRSWGDHLIAKAGIAYPTAPPSWPPKAVLINRKGGSRGFKDNDLLVTAFGEAGITLSVVEMEGLEPKAQVELMTRTDILIGVHGAGLAMGVYMRPGSAVVALNPTNLAYWEKTLFHRFTHLAGLGYYEWDEHDPEFERSAGRGWAKDEVRFKHDEEWHGIKWCEDLRVLVAQVAAVWVREAERAAALRASVPRVLGAAAPAPEHPAAPANGAAA